MRFKNMYMKEETQLPKIYCDMDGVLTNWNKEFEKLGHGTAKYYEKKNGKNSYWKLIADKGEDFWSKMEWMKDGKQLWKFIEQFKPTILTSPTRDVNGHNSCISGKKKWLKRELPSVPYIIEHDKDKYANENAILIDDYTEKINKWKGKGGTGILHTSADKTINTLKKMGFK